MTGDIVQYNEKENSIRIVGRKNSEIIKHKGFKIGSLEIESKLIELPKVIEAVVVGEPDDQYGEIVVAILLLRNESYLDLDKDAASKEISQEMEKHLPKYKIPSRFIFVRQIPRNAMGKVNKKTVLQEIKPIC